MDASDNAYTDHGLMRKSEHSELDSDTEITLLELECLISSLPLSRSLLYFILCICLCMLLKQFTYFALKRLLYSLTNAVSSSILADQESCVTYLPVHPLGVLRCQQDVSTQRGK